MRVPLARRMAKDAVAAQYADFAPEVVTKLKLCLLDLFACAFEARNLPWSRRAATLAAAEGGPATVLATGESAAIPAAALANGVAGPRPGGGGLPRGGGHPPRGGGVPGLLRPVPRRRPRGARFF